MKNDPSFVLGASDAAAVPVVRFEAEKVGGFPPPTDALLDEAIALLNQRFFSAEFKDILLKADMKITLGLTPEQVYERITAPNTTDGRIVMRLAVYPDYAGGGEVGVTTTEADGQHLTSTFAGYITQNGAKCYAAQLAHEYCHWVGFTHPRFRFIGNKQHLSVPYVVGDLFAEFLGADCP